MKKSVFITGLVLALSTVFYSCGNIADPDMGTASVSNSVPKGLCVLGGKIDVDGALPEKYRNALDGGQNPGSAKTAMPEVPGTIRYRIKAKDSVDETKVYESTSDDGSFSVPVIPEKTYNLEVYGYDFTGASPEENENTLIFYGEKKNVEVPADGLADLSITTNAISSAGGKGTVHLTIGLASGTGVKTVCYSWGEGTSQKKVVDVSSSSSFDVIIGSNADDLLDSGTYRIKFDFYNGTISAGEPTGQILYSCTEAVNVFNNMDTTAWISSGNSLHLRGGAFSVSSADVQSFARSVYYVSSTGQEGNTGTYYDPFPTLKDALNAVQAVNDGVKEFKIFLLSDVTPSAGETMQTSASAKSFITLNPLSTLKLKIASYGTGGPYAIDAQGSSTNLRRVMYVGDYTTLTLENIILKGGYIKDASGAGFYVSTSASVTLNSGAKISGNMVEHSDLSTIQKGVGAYIEGTFEMNDGASFSENGLNYTENIAGGGLYFTSTSRVTINGGEFYKNKAMYAGAIYIPRLNTSSYFTMTGGVFKQNSALETGGAILIGSNSQKTINISNVEFERNVSASNGGAIEAQSAVVLTDCKFVRNSSDKYGGAVIFDGGASKILGEDTLFDRNSAEYYGGAFSVNGSNLSSASVEMTAGTVSGNTCGAGRSGNAVSVFDYAENNTLGHLKLSGSVTMDADQDIYLSYAAASTEPFKFIETGTFTGNADIQKFSVSLAKYEVGQNVLKPGTTYSAETAGRFVIYKDGAVTSDYWVDTNGKLAAPSYDGALSFVIDDVTINLDKARAYEAVDTKFVISAVVDKGLPGQKFINFDEDASDWVIKAFSNGVDISSNSKIAIENTDSERSVTVKSGVLAGTSIQIFVSFNYKGKPYGGSIIVPVCNMEVTGDDFADVIGQLPSGGPYEIKVVSGVIPDADVAAVLNDASRKIELDLSADTDYTEIPSSYFRNCTSLTKVVLPDTVTAIENGAFTRCTNLREINIPSNVTDIGSNAFANCSQLDSVIFEDTSHPWEIYVVAVIGTHFPSTADVNADAIKGNSSRSWRKTDTFNGDTFASAIAASEGTGPFTFKFSNTLTSGEMSSIKTTIINNSDKLLNLDFSETILSSISGSAFSNCTNILSIDLPDSVESIGNSAFYKCTGLTGITLPSGLKTIAAFAFKDSAITSVTVPSSVDLIYKGAFEGCTDLTGITFEDSSSEWVSINPSGTIQSFDVTNPSQNVSKLKTYPGTELSLHKVVSVSASDFATVLASENSNGPYSYNIAAPCTASDIALIKSALSVNSTKKVILNLSGTGLTSIPKDAFKSCANLTSITLPAGLKEIGEAAFSGTSLTSVTIPAGVDVIASNALAIGTGLTSVIFEDASSKWTYINTSENTFDEFVPGTASTNAETLRNAVGYFSKHIASDADDFNTEYYFDGYPRGYIYRVKISNSGFDVIYAAAGVAKAAGGNFADPDAYIVLDLSETEFTEIDTQLFQGYTNLVGIILPTSVNKIGVDAFEGCTSLTYVEFKDTSRTWRANGNNLSVTDAAQNAANLKSAYSGYIWNRN